MVPTSILVLGAGELGTAVLHGLAQHRSRSDTIIAVLLRASTIISTEASKKEHVARLKALGILTVTGDVVEDPTDQLSATFGGFDTVVNCTGMTCPPGTQVKVAKAVIASACRRYFPWQFGVDYDIVGRNSAQDLWTEQLDVRALLRSQSTLKWVIISTGIFTAFIFEPAFGIVSVDRESVTALGSWENRVATTTPEDIGKLTAEIALAHPETHGVVFTAGDTVSMRDIADIVDQVLGRTVHRSLKTVDQLQGELAVDPENGMLKYQVAFAEGVGTSWNMSSTFNVQHHIDTQDARQWAQINLMH